MKKFRSLLFLSLFAAAPAFSQETGIVPQPVSVTTGNGVFSLGSATRIVVNGAGAQKSASFLNLYLRRYHGASLTIVAKDPGSNTIVLKTTPSPAKTSKGHYTLTVGARSIIISGDEEGVFYGVQSLIQLLPLEKMGTLGVPQVSVTDSARFAYRGMHLDVARHFFPVSFVKKFIDFIALYKMNTFHWHLTDDQGWRIDIKKYPRLAQVGGHRNGTIIGHHPGTGNDGQREGGYYTQEEIREVVKYAADRYITVIPEIEMPGHASAAIAAYPQLSCFPEEPTRHPEKVSWYGTQTGKQVQQAWGVYDDVFAPTEYTFKFLQDVLDEVIQLFPSKYIHIGGDECPKDAWKRSAFCQELIKDKGLQDEHGLQSYFIQRMEKYLNGKGRRIIGWDEILEGGLAPNATVMSWRGEKGGIEAAKQKHNVIMTPGGWMYFDHSQTKNDDSLTIGGFLPLEKVYSYEPVPAELSASEEKYILGAQANLWTEYIANPRKAEYMIFPRISALSEVQWSPKQEKNWDRFRQKMKMQYRWYDWMGVNYFGGERVER